MTPPERARLAFIGGLLAIACDEEYAELRLSAIRDAANGIKALLKRKPWQPSAGRYYLVDVPLGNGVELTPAELTRLIRLLEAAKKAEDGELLEKLRTL